ncbi:MAG: pilin [Ilumatobacteraceae bacterium]|nr:pilin [Ilumatobacteraceae bacterium]
MILAGSACRTTITEVIQTSSSVLPAAGDWGCESSVAQSKYVASIVTDATGMVTVASQAIGGVTGNVTLKPLNAGNTAPAVGTTVHKWRCGLPGDGTTVAAKYLPGSCRGEN